jgi:homoaconitate hydratase
MGQTKVEKIVTHYAVGLDDGQLAHAGDFVMIRPRHVMTHDNTGAVIPKFEQMGATKIADPAQPVFAIDHDIQNITPENLGKYAKIDAFARKHGIDFYPAGTGISHQVMVEQGYVTPGSLVVGSDSHSNLYGAIAALGTPVVRTDAASIWATGMTWWQVPPIARVELTGTLRPGVVGKDVIIALCGLFNKDEVLNMVIEFCGEGVKSLSVDQRMCIANMTTEWGALAGVFPFDETLREYFYGRAEYFSKGARPGRRTAGSRGNYSRADVDRWWSERLRADTDALYAIELKLDLGTVIPYVSGPNDVKTMTSLPEIERKKIKINKAWLMSCVNARFEDLAEAARVVRGKKVATGVEFYLAAASAEVQQRSAQAGDWQALVDAGAIELPPGCGTCIGLGRGTIKEGEVGISATNRNFEGRMGDRKGLVYLGSPAVVAASAIAGYICSPVHFEPQSAKTSAHGSTPTVAPAGEVKIVKGFPDSVRGRTLFLNRNNINTDGIYAGKWTYKDDLTPTEMTGVIFDNYDPGFRQIARAGDVIVSGRNFGTGSSREQAATALKYFGIPCIIAVNFSETYKRNAFNNGFPVLECPGLVEYLATQLGAVKDATVIGPEILVDYRRSVVACEGREFRFPPLSPVAQELVVAGGAENVVAARLNQGK